MIYDEVIYSDPRSSKSVTTRGTFYTKFPGKADGSANPCPTRPWINIVPLLLLNRQTYDEVKVYLQHLKTLAEPKKLVYKLDIVVQDPTDMIASWTHIPFPSDVVDVLEITFHPRSSVSRPSPHASNRILSTSYPEKSRTSWRRSTDMVTSIKTILHRFVSRGITFAGPERKTRIHIKKVIFDFVPSIFWTQLISLTIGMGPFLPVFGNRLLFFLGDLEEEIMGLPTLLTGCMEEFRLSCGDTWYDWKYNSEQGYFILDDCFQMLPW